MNSVKNLIQKEEYISLAINKYILQTATIPKKDDNSLYWDKLKTSDYLGVNFNITNPITSKDLKVTFDANNNVYIQGIIEKKTDYIASNNYLYNFYVNNIFRVNTIPPTNITQDKLLIGSQILYNDIQKEIVALLNENEKIKFPNQSCTINSYYYELNNSKLTYKYCKSDATSFNVYQEEPIYVETSSDLNYIRANIGTKAYVKNSDLSWSEKYFTGYNDTDGKSEWTNSLTVSEPSTDLGDDEKIQDKILSYIPNSKDLMFRREGGCMLANGDIFCWGNNQYKKAGVENYGQLDNTLKPYFINTPVMLKVQIDSTEIGGVNPNSIKWYNNPYRVKFQKMAMNSTNVCAVSPIFSSTTNKYGGDLYCNGLISSTYYDITSSETSILSRNNYFADKRKSIYLKDIAMVEDVIAVLSDSGKIYVIGKNYKGSLGLNKNDNFYTVSTPTLVSASSDIVFEKIFALRDSRTFGAVDSNKNFYIWGERTNSIITKPTLIGYPIQFNPDAIFVNTNEFILKGINGVYYKTKENLEIESINSSFFEGNPISLSYYKNNKNQEYFLYIDENLRLKGTSSLLSCRQTNETSLCDNSSTEIFDSSLLYLNTPNNETNSNLASFTNVSIFKLDQQITEISEDFEKRVTTDWKDYNGNNITTTTVVSDNGDTSRIPATTYLGRFPIVTGTCDRTITYPYKSGNNNYTTTICKEALVKPYVATKTYSFPGYANYEVDIEFDFYEIDSWDGERFEFYANGELLAQDHFVKNNHQFLVDSNITGVSLQKNVGNNSGENPQMYRYKLRTKLDANAKVVLKFQTTLEFNGNADSTNPPTLFDGLGEPIYGNFWSKFDEGISNEGWGIDNVKVKLKETYKKFVCAMTGLESASQMYCWGNIGRSIPILSTSLYDVSKISSINKLFISQEADKTSRMSFTNFNDEGDSNTGNLFLKYPTYIGGFDYPFYFK
jgi:hypothetical protein